MSGALDYAAAARALRSARGEGRTLDVLLSRSPGLSLADAYRVQDQVTALRLADGEKLAGWKLGYTSAVMRAQMGVEAPNFGPLTDAMLLSSPAVLPAGALQPRVEPEIGLRLGRRLAGPSRPLVRRGAPARVTGLHDREQKRALYGRNCSRS